jgi:hypothetical protein
MLGNAHIANGPFAPRTSAVDFRFGEVVFIGMKGYAVGKVGRQVEWKDECIYR